MKRLIFFLSSALSCARAPVEALPPVSPPEPTLDAMVEQHTRWILEQSPEWSTQLGVSEERAGIGFNGRLADYSPSANESIRNTLASMKTELDSIERDSLRPSEQLTYDVLRFSYDLAARQNRFGVGHPSVLGAAPPYAVNPLFGPQIDIPRLLMVQHPLRSRADAKTWLSRLAALPRVLDELAAMTERDAKHGVTPPAFALEAIAKASKNYAKNPDTHPLLAAFRSRIDTVDSLSEEEQLRLSSEAKSILGAQVLPAFHVFAARMESLVPFAGEHAGLWRLKDGQKMYSVALESWGANGLTPEEIHRIGLEDVARLHREMDRILRSIGSTVGSVGERMAKLASDPRFLIENTDEAKSKLVQKLQSDIDSVLARAPRWFLHVPEQPIQVRRIPPHEENSAGGGYYTPPPLDGSRPGIFWINLKDAREVPTYTLKSLVMHEAVPGHHFQASRALALDELPLIQKMVWFGDYGEGWALYAEELADEMGLYDADPMGTLGRYRMELYRAVRLVVDTGLHHKRWSRERAVSYMVEATGEPRSAIAREIDRYAVWPGQAASYKLGMIQFQRLRRHAERELGARFDVREFHDELLRHGPMPMQTLSQRIDSWIEAKR
ncbi:MAG: DUF885 domain-containing protein [Myxococcota bacterium]